MTQIVESRRIGGVFVAELSAFEDERGRFMETFRRSWFPQRDWTALQMNRSESKRGVLRGLHYHHYQVDYWHVVSGSLRAALVDIRPDSPTFKQTDIIPMGGPNQIGLFIPIGVAHGFVAVTDVMLTYIVDSYYDGGGDEFGVAWNDPDLALDWGVATPQLSQRDLDNPRLRDIVLETLPTVRP